MHIVSIMMFLQKISILLVAATSLLTHTINGDISEETGESQLIDVKPIVPQINREVDNQIV